MNRLSLPIVMTALLLCTPTFSQQARYKRDSKGVVSVPITVPQSLQNPWPDKWEADFQKRSNSVIKAMTTSGRYGSTWFENEKRAYANAMISVLGGEEEAALKFLQAEDAAAEKWNKHTLGIDYFPCFTLKHQIRKYFFFGNQLDPKYRDRMEKAAKIFTEKDPLRRPHYAYDGTSVWDPQGKDSWVDVRSTDNLKLMRDTSVYLFAEETRNEKTRQLYKKHLQDFIVTMFHTGMGEWDSENYIGHSFAPLLNLYDFAKDDDVRRLAKAALDHISAGVAVKYFRGNFNGPTKRDYNHPYPLSGSASGVFWLYFGENTTLPESFEPDLVHVITSSYRPPVAIMNLAKKSFKRPVELFAGKAGGNHWERPDAAAPDYRETQYIGRHFLFGTLARGTQNPDVNGFKIIAEHPSRGADTIVAAPCNDPLLLGSPMYKEGKLAPHTAVGQNGNMAIVLTQQSDQPFLFLIPKDYDVSSKNGVTFLSGLRITIAIWPINLTSPKPDRELTATAQSKPKNKKKPEGEHVPRWPNAQILKATRQGPGAYGYAIEISEGDAETFREQASMIKPETAEVSVRGAAAMTSVSGKRVRLQSGTNLNAISIWRDGKLRDWDAEENKALFHTVDGGLIQSDWQSGTLAVDAGSAQFRIAVTRDGKVTWSEDR